RKPSPTTRRVECSKRSCAGGLWIKYLESLLCTPETKATLPRNAPDALSCPALLPLPCHSKHELSPRTPPIRPIPTPSSPVHRAVLYNPAACLCARACMDRCWRVCLPHEVALRFVAAPCS